MSKDHYVARTYLKHFGDPDAEGILHAYQKPSAKTFDCWPKDVCHEWDGDLNPSMTHPELLGKFRKVFEPRWNESVANILAGEISPQDKLVVSAYMSNLMVCTPAWRRVGVTAFNHQAVGYLSNKKRMLEKHGGANGTLTETIELLEKGELKFETDPNYVRGIVTKHLMEYTWLTYNVDWTIVENKTDLPFVTSDNPVAFDYSGTRGEPVIRHLPITPKLCLSVRYDPSKHHVTRLNPKSLADDIQREPHGKIELLKSSRNHARRINRVVVQSAEELVFSCKPSAGLSQLVNRFGRFGIESEYAELPTGEEGRVFQVTTIRVRERCE